MATFSFWMMVVLIGLIGVGVVLWLVSLFIRRDTKEKDDV